MHVYLKRIMTGAALGLLHVSALSAAEPTLSPQLIVQKVTESSVPARESILSKERAALQEQSVKASFDTLITAQTQLQNNRSESLAGFGGQSDRTLFMTAGVARNFMTGTSLAVSYDQIYQNAELPPLLRSFREPNQHYANISVQVKQNLLRDAWGEASQTQIELARAGVIQTDLAVDQQLEVLALNALELYWQAYASQGVMQELDKSIERLQNLARYSRDRQRVGAADVGELQRVEADIEAQKQRRTLTISAYRQLEQRLCVLLAIECSHSADVQLKAQASLGSRPQPSTLTVSNLKSYRLAESQLSSLQLAENLTKSTSDPKLLAFARFNSSGLDPKLIDTWSEVAGIRRPGMSLGLEFEMFLDQQGARTKLAEKRIEKAQARLALERIQDDAQAQDRVLLIDAQGRYDIARNAERIVQLRKSAADAIEAAFRQGRIGFDQLTLALNALIIAEIDKHQAYSQYFVALDRQRALRNQLISYYKE